MQAPGVSSQRLVSGTGSDIDASAKSFYLLPGTEEHRTPPKGTNLITLALANT